MQPGMIGSPNPEIMRNYRTIFPNNFRSFNLTSEPGKYPGENVGNRKIHVIFKVLSAPVVLPYESYLIIRIGFDKLHRDGMMQQAMNLRDTLSNEWSANPAYRIKLKSIGHAIERAWATMSNMTYQSVRPAHYLNEIMLRRPFPIQQKYPDNYTGEKCFYARSSDFCARTDGLPLNGKAGLSEDDISAMTEAAQNIIGAVGRNVANDRQYGLFLEPLNRAIPGEGSIQFTTPQTTSSSRFDFLTFRIPLTEILPVFKIGVIPLITVNASSIDLDISLFSPHSWLVQNPRMLGSLATAEISLSITTVSFPTINPLAEALIRPRIFGDKFIAPYLDYLTWDVALTADRAESEFSFQITQALANVPFFSISFVDETTYPSGSVVQTNDHPISVSTYNNPQDGMGIVGYMAQLEPGIPDKIKLSPHERERGGFFSLPPDIYCDQLQIHLGQSFLPWAQYPLSWDDMYDFNRRHFEMYGRDFNVYRVSPNGRVQSGDASFFFDLSHAPMSGFKLGPESPLSVRGKIINPAFTTITSHSNDQTPPPRKPTIRIVLTAYYSNNFTVFLDSGSVVSLQNSSMQPQ